MSLTYPGKIRSRYSTLGMGLKSGHSDSTQKEEAPVAPLSSISRYGTSHACLESLLTSARSALVLIGESGRKPGKRTAAATADVLI